MCYIFKKTINVEEPQTKAESLDSSKPPLSSPPFSPAASTNVYHAKWLDATKMNIQRGTNSKRKRPGWQFDLS